MSPWPSELPRIETERLVLRELTGADAPALFRTYSDPEVTGAFMAEPLVDVGQAEGLIAVFLREFAAQHAITWAVVPSDTDECIGTCSLTVGSASSVELGYDLATQWWGQGLMTEALGAVLAYAFDELHVEVVVADTRSTNARSIRLLERLGFRLDDERDGRRFFSLRGL